MGGFRLARRLPVALGIMAVMIFVGWWVRSQYNHVTHAITSGDARDLNLPKGNAVIIDPRQMKAQADDYERRARQVGADTGPAPSVPLPTQGPAPDNPLPPARQ